MAVALKPFFSYYGGKFRAAPRYPKPLCKTIIEPFAGAAGYAVRYHTHDVVLVERNPVVAALWRWLISAPREEIEALPLVGPEQSVNDFDLRPEHRALIGFWLNAAHVSPCLTPSSWMRSQVRPQAFWGADIRQRVAEQVEHIRHWTVLEGDYSDAPGIAATWFVDPPYANKAGQRYTFGSKQMDFDRLGEWCLSRQGQLIVCENDGADWLPFEPYLTIRGTPGRHRTGRSAEALYYVAGTDLA